MQVIEKETRTRAGMPVVVARPEGAARFPAVVLLHERFGLVQHTLNKAKRLAGEGYVVASPNLFYRFEDQEALHAATAKYLPADKEVTTEIEDVAALIDADFGADLDHFAVMGFCQTGRYPMIYAASHTIRACVTFYGGLNDDDWAANELNPIPFEDYLDDVNAPIFGVYAEQDSRIPIGDVIKFRNALERRNKSYQFTIYNRMPHGFLNDTIPERFRPEEAERAWADLLVFLDAHVANPAEQPNDEVRWSFRRI